MRLEAEDHEHFLSAASSSGFSSIDICTSIPIMALSIYDGDGE